MTTEQQSSLKNCGFYTNLSIPDGFKSSALRTLLTSAKDLFVSPGVKHVRSTNLTIGNQSHPRYIHFENLF
jgi:hypothetical protein